MASTALFVNVHPTVDRGVGLGCIVVRCDAGECAQDLQAEPLRQPGRDRVAHLVRRIGVGLGLG